MSDTICPAIFNPLLHRFQWAALQIHQLFAITLAVDIEKTLGKLPITLEQAYDQIWTTIRDGGPFAYQLATRALMWVLCSMRPLNMEEWAKASYPPADYPSDGSGATTLLGLCRNLVIWDSQLDRMSFAHLSVQEYLEARIFDIIQAHSMAAQSCLLYLTYPNHALNGRKHKDSVHERTFENYVLMWWGYHFQRAFNEDRHMSDQAREQLQEFLGTPTKPGPYYCKWLENVTVLCARFMSRSHLDTEYYYLRSIPPNPLFAMSFYNFGGELEQHWELDVFNANCENLARESLLQVAIVRGNQWVVEYLCSKGADVNAIINRRSLLMLAIDLNRGAALCALLDRGAKIDAVDGVYPTLLHAAASRGGAGAVEAILSRGADASEKIVLAAAENGQRGAEIMKLLLTREDKIQTTEAIVVAALANKGSTHGLMELLFDRGPSLQVPDEPVVAALDRGNFGAVEVVLDKSSAVSEVVLVAVAASGLWGIKLITKLLLTRDAGMQITGTVLAAVMENQASGPELMELLFLKNPSLKVPDVAVLATAGSTHGLQLTQPLLARGAIPITESLLIAAFSVLERDPKLVQLLTRGRDIAVTEAVLAAAAANPWTPEEILVPLLARNPDLKITEATLEAAATNFPVQIVGLLLARSLEITITQATLKAAASNRFSSTEIVELLLARNPDIKITEAILTAAVSNMESDTRIVELLLASGPNIEITGAVLTAAASNSLRGVEILKLLLTRTPDIEITEGVLTAAVSNKHRGTEILRLLLAKGCYIETTEVILTTAASNTNCGAEILEVLLPRNPDIEITEAILIAAVSNPWNGAEILELLLARNSNIKITEAVVKAAAACEEYPCGITRALSASSHRFEVDFPLVMAVADFDWEFLRLLLARYPNIPANETELVVAVKSKRHPELIAGFLLERNATLKVTEAVVIAALERDYCRVELVKLLLARSAELRISEAISAAAVKRLEKPGGWGIIELLLKHNGIIQLPEITMMDALSGNLSRGLLPLLLAADSEIKVTSSLLAEVVATAWGSEEFMQVLLAVSGTIKITEEVLVAAAANGTKRGESVAVALIELLLARNPSLRITEAVMIAAVGSSCAVEVLKDLWVKDNTLRVTEAVVVAAAANTSCGPEVVGLLVAIYDTLEVTERIMVAAAANDGCGPQVMELLLARDVTTNLTEEIMVVAAANSNCGLEVMRLLLTRDENIKVTERILMASVASTQGSAVVELLLAYDATAEVTGALVMAVARSGTGRAMEHLLDRNPSIERTDAIVKAVAENSRPLDLGGWVEPWSHSDVSFDWDPSDSIAQHEIKEAFKRRDAARDAGAFSLHL